MLFPSPSLTWSVLYQCCGCPPRAGTQRCRAVSPIDGCGGWGGGGAFQCMEMVGSSPLFLCWALSADYKPYLQLLDSYFEAYQHALDPEERFALAQVITDIMHRCPRFDFSHPYFIKAYQEECTCLRLHLQLVRGILNQHVSIFGFFKIPCGKGMENTGQN